MRINDGLNYVCATDVIWAIFLFYLKTLLNAVSLLIGGGGCLGVTRGG